MEKEGGYSVVNVVENPTIKWCSVTLSDVIDRGKRLEASVFDVEAKQAFNIIKNSKYPKVNLISPDGFVEKAHYGGRLKRNYIKPNSINSIGFIGSSEMLDIYPNPVKFMLNDKKVEDLRVKENTIYNTLIVSPPGIRKNYFIKRYNKEYK